ncbi:MAG: hypothetical protein RR646_03380 [Erysipelotrichaceae bacterium]
MKAVIFACALSFVSLSIVLAASWLISFDNAQYMTSENTKSVLKAVMAEHIDDEIELDQFMLEFEERFKVNALKDYSYDIEVKGYRNNPKYINIGIVASNKDGMKIKVNETMIEGIRNE